MLKRMKLLTLVFFTVLLIGGYSTISCIHAASPTTYIPTIIVIDSATVSGNTVTVKGWQLNKTNTTSMVAIFDGIDEWEPVKPAGWDEDWIIPNINGWYGFMPLDSSLPRPDVYAIYKDKYLTYPGSAPLSANCGFSFTSLPLSPGKHVITIQATTTRTSIGLCGLAPYIIYYYKGVQVIKSITVNIPKPLSSLNFIDTPVANSSVPNKLNVSGWSLAPSGIKEVDVFVDNVKTIATIGILRTDVYNKYSAYNSQNSGYTASVSLNNTIGKHTILVRSIANNGAILNTTTYVSKLNPVINIDTPKSLANSSKVVYIAGWSLNSSNVKQVTIALDNVIKGSANINLARADVYKRYKSYNSQKSGFNYNLSLAKVAKGKHTITITSIGIDNSIITKSVAINVK